MKAAREGQQLESEEALDGLTLATEFMLNALRLAEGFDRRLFSARTGLPWRVLHTPLATALARGWLQEDGEWLRPTALGFRFLNDLQLLFTGLDAHAA
jgi:coproporphyrinogen III oxidase-like Fe-S oxidoreductase